MGSKYCKILLCFKYNTLNIFNRRMIMINNRPAISIIVPMYNSESTIDKCIKSILNQTLSDLELILVDDGSNDNTLSICREYMKLDNRIIVVTQENGGQTAARKRGVEIAQSDVIGFVDSDDWIECDMYKELYHIFSVYKTDLVSSGISRDYDKDGYKKVVLDNFEEGYYNNLKDNIMPYMLWNKELKDYGIYCTLVNKLFKKELLIDVYNEIDTRVFYGEDSLTLYSYVMKCKNLFILKKSYYHYIIKGESMCSKVDEKLPMNTYYLYKGLENAFIGYGDLTYKLLEQLRYYILNVESHTLMSLYNINIMSLTNVELDIPPIVNKNIILYGAGGCSRIIYNYLIDVCKCNVIAWVDKYPEGKDKFCLHNIQHSNIIEQLSYDYIYVAVLSKDLYGSIKKELIKRFDVKEDKIVWGDITFSNYKI